MPLKPRLPFTQQQDSARELHSELLNQQEESGKKGEMPNKTANERQRENGIKTRTNE